LPRCALAGGAASLLVPILPRTVGLAALGLGALAVVVARSLHVPSEQCPSRI
jgi:hypothetical protein